MYMKVQVSVMCLWKSLGQLTQTQRKLCQTIKWPQMRELRHGRKGDNFLSGR